MASGKDAGDEELAGRVRYHKDFRTALPQIIAVSVKNLLLLGYGTTLGFPTILIPAVQNPAPGETLHLQKSELSWISSINLIVVPVGCALSGVVTAPLGRRRAMQLVNVPFFIAWLIFHFSTNTAHLYGALFLTGLAGGLLEAPVLTYVAEITQPHLRGALTATSSMSIIFGVFTQFLLGSLLYWRTVALVNITFTILAVIALCFVPESPHWLVSRKRHDDARKSLQWLRGWTNPYSVEDELKDVQALYMKKKADGVDVEETLSEKFANYTSRSFLVPFALVCYSFFVGHFSGMTTLQTYAVSIFHMLEAPIDKYYATLILGILQIIGTGLCVLLVHYTGKRPLTLFSTAGAAVCCLLVAGYDGYMKSVVGTTLLCVLLLHCTGKRPLTLFATAGAAACCLLVAGSDGYMKTHGLSAQIEATNVTTAAEEDLVMKNNPYSWMPMTLLMLLALITHTGIRLLPWILIGEVFSARTRSGSAGLASAVGYVFGFVTNKMYINMVDSLSIWGTYGFYSVVCFTGCAVLYFVLPETEGKKLNDIENHFAGKKKLTNEVYRSKKKSKAEISRMQELKGSTNPTFEGDNSKL